MDRLVEVVKDICGLHAQVMQSAELAIGLRVAGATKEDVRAELWERRGLVKTYALRGTVHLLPAGDLSLWLAAMRTGSRVLDTGLPQLQGEHERARSHAIVEAITEALDGRQLTREELGQAVVRRCGPWAGEKVFPAFGEMWPRWWVEIGAAALAGVLCFGPNRGRRVTYVRPDQWIGHWEGVDGREALTEVFRRYLAAYGPATAEDFARWFDMDPDAARDLARSLDRQLAEVDVEGWRGLLLAADVDGDWPRSGGCARLLPQFDGRDHSHAPRRWGRGRGMGAAPPGP
jgi:hypothetical protein